ncbi:MAG: PAS domain S-box protein [Acidobacteria bacterium]|nr:PAS domain S-box protein [Acidobacteriota bacterium]MBI3656613.1 PAS domain S-box protein [Acidobacteriota bacterium]
MFNQPDEGFPTNSRAVEDRPQESFGRIIFGPIILLTAILTLLLLTSLSYRPPDLRPVLLLIIVFSAFTGGLVSGAAGSLLLSIYIAFALSPPGQPFRYGSHDVAQVMVWTFASFATALLIGFLSRRARRLSQAALKRERYSASLQASFHERKRTDAAVRESEERYRTLTETVGDAIITINEEGQMLMVNPAAESLFGYTMPEMVGQPLTMLMPASSRPLHQASLRLYVETGIRGLDWKSVRLTGLHKLGKELPLEISLCEFLKDGRHLFTGIMRDLAEEKQAKAGLQDCQVRYLGVTQATHDAIWDWDLITNAMVWNQGIRTLFGYAEDMVGPNVTGWTSRIHPDDRDRISQSLHEVIEGGGEAWSGEYRFQCRDGAYTWVSSRCSVVRNEDGKALRVIGALRDLAERKQAAETLENVRQELQSKIRMLEKQYQDTERLVHTVSHDLRGPLVSIQGFAAQMRRSFEEQLGAEGNFYLERLVRSTDQLEKLMENLWRFIKVGQADISRTEVDVGNLVSCVLARLDSQIKDKAIATRVAKTMPVVMGIPADLAQVFDNIISNAVKYIGNPPDPCIDIDCREEQGEWVFTIRDNGVGIPKEDQPKIFGALARLPDAKLIHPAGTGFGLSVAKRIIELHGGVIWLESGAGRGAAFHFTLPKPPIRAESRIMVASTTPDRQNINRP